MKEREIDFLTELKDLLVIHEAVLCLETEAIGWGGADAKLTFDIKNHTIGNLIKENVTSAFDIGPEFIQKLIDNLKKQV